MRQLLYCILPLATAWTNAGFSAGRPLNHGLARPQEMASRRGDVARVTSPLRRPRRRTAVHAWGGPGENVTGPPPTPSRFFRKSSSNESDLQFAQADQALQRQNPVIAKALNQVVSAVDAARKSNSTKTRRLSFKTRRRADQILENSNHLANTTLEAYMSIPPEDYVTFDEKVLQRVDDGVFRLEFPIPTQIFKGVEMCVVCDLAVNHAPQSRKNTWTGSDFGLTIDNFENLGGVEEARKDREAQLEFRDKLKAVAEASLEEKAKVAAAALPSGNGSSTAATQRPEEVFASSISALEKTPDSEREEAQLIGNRVLARQLTQLDLQAQGECTLEWIDGPQKILRGPKRGTTLTAEQSIIRGELEVKVEMTLAAPWSHIPGALTSTIANFILRVVSKFILTKSLLALEQDYKRWARGEFRGGNQGSLRGAGVGGSEEVGEFRGGDHIEDHDHTSWE